MCMSMYMCVCACTMCPGTCLHACAHVYTCPHKHLFTVQYTCACPGTWRCTRAHARSRACTNVSRLGTIVCPRSRIGFGSRATMITCAVTRVCTYTCTRALGCRFRTFEHMSMRHGIELVCRCVYAYVDMAWTYTCPCTRSCTCMWTCMRTCEQTCV